MHSSHIKPQNFGIQAGFQPRKAKPRSVEAELVAPVPEWGRDEKKRKPAYASRGLQKDDGEETTASNEASLPNQAYREEKAEPAVQIEDDNDLVRLLGAASMGSSATQAKLGDMRVEEDASLEELLNQFTGASSSGISR